VKISGFLVLYRRYDDNASRFERQAVRGATTHDVVLRNLHSGTAYSIVVHSFNGHGRSEPSNTVVHYTLSSADDIHRHRHDPGLRFSS